MSASTALGRIVMPIQVSPLRIMCSRMIDQPMLRSIRFDGFSISTIALPLERAGLCGRRTRIRVVYGAFGVRTTAGPAAGQL